MVESGFWRLMHAKARSWYAPTPRCACSSCNQLSCHGKLWRVPLCGVRQLDKGQPSSKRGQSCTLSLLCPAHAHLHSCATRKAQARSHPRRSPLIRCTTGTAGRTPSLRSQQSPSLMLAWTGTTVRSCVCHIAPAGRQAGSQAHRQAGRQQRAQSG